MLKTNANHQYLAMIGICRINLLNSAKKLNLTQLMVHHNSDWPTADIFLNRMIFGISSAKSIVAIVRASANVSASDSYMASMTVKSIVMPLTRKQSPRMRKASSHPISRWR